MSHSRGKMIEQKIEICFDDPNGHEIGVILLKPERYYAESCPTRTKKEIKLFNVPELAISNKIPLQFKQDPLENLPILYC